MLEQVVVYFLFLVPVLVAFFWDGRRPFRAGVAAGGQPGAR